MSKFDQLIKDLRDPHCGDGTTTHINMRKEAADAIQELLDDLQNKRCSSLGIVFSPVLDYPGLKRKYIVLKSDTGELVDGCFVLRPDKDEAAIAALVAYAGATGNKQLAADILAWIDVLSGGC